jgi:hypothetical protein
VLSGLGLAGGEPAGPCPPADPAIEMAASKIGKDTAPAGLASIGARAFYHHGREMDIIPRSFFPAGSARRLHD